MDQRFAAAELPALLGKLTQIAALVRGWERAVSLDTGAARIAD